jgi:GDPmannose 4,6-dehydratase
MKLLCPTSRFYQASSSEMFGNSFDDDGFQRETTPMHPTSPYGCAKVYGYNITRNYRHSYNLFASNGILFNHESPRRGSNFVTNKVAKEAVRIKYGLTDKLLLGNLDATRDWGHAKDYVKCMWLMLQQDTPDDFVCSTGVSHSVRELCEHVFGKLDLDYKDYVGVDQKYMRPEELTDLKGDSSKARWVLDWTHEYTFETMLDEMVDHWEVIYG